MDEIDKPATTPTPAELADRLEALVKDATPGPYRLHDHTTYPFDEPEKWIGYAWVGRITKSSTADGRFDAGWFETDRRQDGDKDYRNRASADANLIVTVLNNLPAILASLRAVEGWQPNKLPRLTDAMIRAACEAHYGTNDIDGVDLTSHDLNYSFREGFKRMWRGVRTALPTPPET